MAFELPKRVLVAGAGVSGRGCVRLLQTLKVEVTVADSNSETLRLVAEEFGVATIHVNEAQPSDYDLVVTSPGWRPTSPLLVAATEAGIEVIGDVELAFRLDQGDFFGPPRRWLVVTGTNGKTTTTGMLAKIMGCYAERNNQRALAVGNIGLSVLEALLEPERVDILVAELSSFQLFWSRTLCPEVGVVLNLAEDHIDWHGSFAEYAAAKSQALTGHTAIVAREDAAVEALSAPADNVSGFSSQTPDSGDIGVIGDWIVDSEGNKLATTVGLQPPGKAGVLDAAAAVAVALAAGANPQDIAEGLAAYTVAGHRGAVVHKAAGVNFIDNSKATNPHAAEAALDGLHNVVWLAGGQLKGAAVDELLTRHKHRLKAVVLIGQDRKIIADACARLAPDLDVEVVEDTNPRSAMSAAVSAALQHAVAGDTVLLAPAAASLDMYTGMAQRGDEFAAAARNLATS